jgi:hypothetical protein
LEDFSWSIAAPQLDMSVNWRRMKKNNMRKKPLQLPPQTIKQPFGRGAAAHPVTQG